MSNDTNTTARIKRMARKIIATAEFGNARRIINLKRGAMSNNIATGRGNYKSLSSEEGITLLEYIDLLEHKLKIDEAIAERNAGPHLHISGITEGAVQRWNVRQVEALLLKARELADKGAPQNDGYDYLVPSKDLAEYASTLTALCAVVAHLTGETSAKTVGQLQNWLEANARAARFPDIALWARTDLELKTAQIKDAENHLARIREAVK